MAQHIESTHHEHKHGEPHIVPLIWYFGVFGVLMVGTILTVITARMDLDVIFPGANTLVALLIAFFKTTCVILIFMHVQFSSRLIQLCVVGSLFWLLIMFAFTMQDYLTRATGMFN
jgi:cytochrome c oxidase subunit IV